MDPKYRHVAKKPNFANQNWLYNSQQPLQRHRTASTPRLIKDSSTIKKQSTIPFSQQKTQQRMTTQMQTKQQTKSVQSIKSVKSNTTNQQQLQKQKQMDDFAQLFERLMQQKQQFE